jgi:hypothetical protein
MQEVLVDRGELVLEDCVEMAKNAVIAPERGDG